MKQKYFLNGILLSIFLGIRVELQASTKASLSLSAYVSSSISIKIRESKINSTQTLWMLSGLINSAHPSEGQKFEVEGLDQSGLDAHVKKAVGSDRTIQYEILINQLKSSMPQAKPIFLKISAN